jgi:hypothetical protein
MTFVSWACFGVTYFAMFFGTSLFIRPQMLYLIINHAVALGCIIAFFFQVRFA